MAARNSLIRHCKAGRVAKRIETRRPWQTRPVSNLELLLLLSVLLFGCRPATPPPGPADQTQVASGTASAAPSASVKPTSIPKEVSEVRNAEYQLGATDALQIVELTDGDFVQGTRGNDTYLAVTMTEFVAVGDLTGDGVNEVAALVSENYGGTGTFVFLAVYANVDGTWTFQTSTMVDDRPRLNALSIQGGEVFLDAVIHATDEPMCCPTLQTTRHYRFVDNLLDMTDYATFTPGGDPRTISIELPVDGQEIFTTVSLKGNVAIAPFENNLTYRIYDLVGVELAAGAIPVIASEPGAPGTFDSTISLGNILSSTVIRIEVQDTSAEDGSLLAMDSVELVVK